MGQGNPYGGGPGICHILASPRGASLVNEQKVAGLVSPTDVVGNIKSGKRASQKRGDLRAMSVATVTWNSLRERDLFIEPDLTGTELREADLARANLTGANLSEANLSRADLTEASLA